MKVATTEIMDDFCYKWKTSCAYHKNQHFVVSKDEWDTKEDTSKSMKSAFHAQQYSKGTSRAEAMSNSAKNQAHSLQAFIMYGLVLWIQIHENRNKKLPDHLADSCKHSSVNWMAAGLRPPRSNQVFFFLFLLFKHFLWS